MATSPRPAAGSLPPDGGPGGRLHIHGIKEMPAGYDAEVAELFRDLRSASGLTEADLAAQLATRPEVVQALEQGALYALPPWPETYRVVATYGTLLNLDVRPLLRRIYAQVDAGVVGLAPKPMPDVPFMTPPENEPEFQAQPAQAAPQPSEPFAPQTRQSAPPPAQQGPQSAPDLRPPPRQQPQPPPQMRPPGQSQPPPQQPGPPPWSPQRGAPGTAPSPSRQPQQPPPLPRPGQGMPREARGPAGPQPPAKPAPQPRGAAPLPLEEEQTKRRLPWKPIIKWGAVALVILGIAAGLWMWLAKPGLLGSGDKSPSAKSSQKAPPADPNDPRSRKADRLPGPS